MISQAVREAILQFVPEEQILFKEPLDKYTTFRIGGEADCMIEIKSVHQLMPLLHYFSKIELPYFVMGNGSNLLVSDKGYSGIILRIARGISRIHVAGNHIYAEAGASLAQVARVACQHGLTGMEFAAGIPGTVGGALVMNAGAYDGEMKQVTDNVTVLDQTGNMLELDNDTMEFGYRTSVIRKQPLIISECSFLLKPGDPEEIADKMLDFQDRRKQKQPLEYASAGSTFKRPEGYFAGKLIMDAGLRGFRIGDAQVSEKHCGFIINRGNATAADVKDVITHVQETVKLRFGVELEPEVIFLGEF